MRGLLAKTLEVLPWLVGERDGQIMGYAYAGRHKERAAYIWSVDASVYIHPQAQRSGLGRALYTSLFALLRLQGFYNIYAGATIPNAGSVGLHESMGFEPVGVYRRVGFKCGAWHDVAWFQRPLQPPSADPPPPRRMGEVRQTPAWQEALTAGRSVL